MFRTALRRSARSLAQAAGSLSRISKVNLRGIATRQASARVAVGAARAIAAAGRTSGRVAIGRRLNVGRPSLPLFNAAPRRWYSTEGEFIVTVPAMGDSISSGKIEKWNKKVGDPVAVDDVLASIETDKLTVEIRAPKSGILKEIYADAGQTVEVGAKLAKIELGAAGAAPAAPQAEAPKAAAPAAPAKATPAPAAPSKPAAAPKVEAPKAAAPKAPTTPVSTGPREVRQPMSMLRQRVAQRLKDAQNTAAMLTTFQEADMSALTNLRNDFKDRFAEKHGVKLGFMSAFVKASAVALVENPVANATIDGTDIVYRNYVDISVAVATPKGLVVPVVRDADKLGFADIERAIADLGKRAREGGLTMEDLTGGTFTISNGGVYGSMMGTPILNPPQSAILGMHAITPRPVAIKDKVEIRPMMYLALTYDHRLLDGRDAVTFLRRIKELIEDPRRFLLDV